MSISDEAIRSRLDDVTRMLAQAQAHYKVVRREAAATEREIIFLRGAQTELTDLVQRIEMGDAAQASDAASGAAAEEGVISDHTPPVIPAGEEGPELEEGVSQITARAV